MKVERGASQILFGMLPGQTADLDGRIWRVDTWVDPVPLALDQDSLRRSLLSAISPWTLAGTDDGMAGELFAGAQVEVVGLNMHRGVAVDTFPELWRCRSCSRLSRKRQDRCRCGARAQAQLHFVAYHSCGALRVPSFPTCPAHNSAAVQLPGTATASELRFFCPDCHATLRRGFPFQPCTCGAGGMSITVHRAGVVYSPRFTVVVNPPDPAVAARLRSGGGAARALEWVLDGMPTTDPLEGPQTVAGFVEGLRSMGISEDTAAELAAKALANGELVDPSAGTPLRLSDPVRERAQDEALSLASAAAGGRVRVADMVAGTTPPLRTLYEGAYGAAMTQAGLADVQLLPNFPVASLAFGYTRGDLTPGATRLVPYRNRNRLRAYGSLNRTEALLFQLDPGAVAEHLRAHGLPVRPATDERDTRTALLEHLEVPSPVEERPQPLGAALVGLVHSYAHRTIRRLAAFAGIERDALAEYLLPHHLAFVVYAAHRGDFVLGGLQAVFETSLHRFLDDFIGGEARCVLDPGCRSGGGACMACLHLGEPSCRWFNRFLDRSHLFGPHGYLLSQP